MDNKAPQSEAKKIPKLRFSEFTDDWEEKKLGDIGEIIGGGTPDTTKEDCWNGEINWFTPTEIKKKYVDNSLRKISKIGLKNSSARILPVGTLLFTSRATVGDVSISTMECSTNQGFQSLAVNEKNSNEFFYYWILLNKKQFLTKANGSTFLEISGKEIRKISSFFPTHPEQQKIAEFLRATDEWIENLKKQKKFFETYKKGMMQKIFSQEIRFKDNNGNKFQNWEEMNLGDVCEYKNGGAFENNIVNNGKYNLINLNSIDITGKLKNKHKTVDNADWYLKKDDLVMVLSDVAHGDFLGLVDIIPENDKYVLNQRMGLLRKKDDRVDLNFLRAYINKQQHYFKLHGQGSSQQNLSKGDILKFEIPVPHLSEQQKIAEFLTSIDKVIESKQQQIVSAERWKKGLMQRMFV